jgi:hypothetical protein
MQTENYSRYSNYPYYPYYLNAQINSWCVCIRAFYKNVTAKFFQVFSDCLCDVNLFSEVKTHFLRAQCYNWRCWKKY